MVDSLFPIPPGASEGISPAELYAAMFLQGYFAKQGFEGFTPAHAEKACAIANTFCEALKKTGIRQS